MPELPEVETTLRGLRPFLEGQKVLDAVVRVPKLRLPLPAGLAGDLVGRTVTAMRRRAKYMLLELDDGMVLVVHLGMSGRFVVVPSGEMVAAPAHTHVELVTPMARLLYVDPRRFGLMVRVPLAEVARHPLLAGLGPEPLGDDFTPDYLWKALRGVKTPIKVALMQGRLVVGVGNIYASEVLFRARIRPARMAKGLTRAEAGRVHACVREVLAEAIAAGGSTLRDYARPDGQLGYFAHDFAVYGRAGQVCGVCGGSIRKDIQAQRATFWCPVCQK